jgi:hypothetical protein
LKNTKIDVIELKARLKTMLEVIGRDYEQVHHQHTDNLAIAAILYSSIKMGMGSGIFLKSLSGLSKRKKVSIKEVKNSESYQLVKKILKGEMCNV